MLRTTASVLKLTVIKKASKVIPQKTYAPPVNPINPLHLYRQSLRLAHRIAQRWHDPYIFHGQRFIAARQLRTPNLIDRDGTDAMSSPDRNRFRRLKTILSRLKRAELGHMAPMLKILGDCYARGGILRRMAIDSILPKADSPKDKWLPMRAFINLSQSPLTSSGDMTPTEIKTFLDEMRPTQPRSPPLVAFQDFATALHAKAAMGKGERGGGGDQAEQEENRRFPSMRERKAFRELGKKFAKLLKHWRSPLPSQVVRKVEENAMRLPFLSQEQVDKEIAKTIRIAVMQEDREQKRKGLNRRAKERITSASQGLRSLASTYHSSQRNHEDGHIGRTSLQADVTESLLAASRQRSASGNEDEQQTDADSAVSIAGDFDPRNLGPLHPGSRDYSRARRRTWSMLLKEVPIIGTSAPLTRLSQLEASDTHTAMANLSTSMSETRQESPMGTVTERTDDSAGTHTHPGPVAPHLIPQPPFEPWKPLWGSHRRLPIDHLRPLFEQLDRQEQQRMERRERLEEERVRKKMDKERKRAERRGDEQADGEGQGGKVVQKEEQAISIDTRATEEQDQPALTKAEGEKQEEVGQEEHIYLYLSPLALRSDQGGKGPGLKTPKAKFGSEAFVSEDEARWARGDLPY